MNRAQLLQRVVFWAIVGPFAVLVTGILLGRAILAADGPNSIRTISSIGFLLMYHSFVGAIVVVHLWAFFGSVGLLSLPWLSVKRKSLTLVVCAVAVGLAAVAIPWFYAEVGLWHRGP